MQKNSLDAFNHKRKILCKINYNMLHSQYCEYCERKVLVYWVKGLTLIKTIERIFGRQSEKKQLIRFAWNMTREWSLTNTLLRFWVGRIDERRIFPFPSSLKMSDITNGFGKEYLTRFYLFSSFNENIEASLK